MAAVRLPACLPALSTGGRQVAVDLGGHFPCSVTNLSNLTTSLIVVMLMCMRVGGRQSAS